MSKVLHILLVLLEIALGFFVVTFSVYFFNLDMKLTAAMDPLFLKYYDTIKRDTHL